MLREPGGEPSVYEYETPPPLQAGAARYVGCVKLCALTTELRGSGAGSAVDQAKRALGSGPWQGA